MGCVSYYPVRHFPCVRDRYRYRIRLLLCVPQYPAQYPAQHLSWNRYLDSLGSGNINSNCKLVLSKLNFFGSGKQIQFFLRSRHLTFLESGTLSSNSKLVLYHPCNYFGCLFNVLNPQSPLCRMNFNWKWPEGFTPLTGSRSMVNLHEEEEDTRVIARSESTAALVDMTPVQSSSSADPAHLEDQVKSAHSIPKMSSSYFQCRAGRDASFMDKAVEIANTAELGVVVGGGGQ